MIVDAETTWDNITSSSWLETRAKTKSTRKIELPKCFIEIFYRVYKFKNQQ